MLSDDFAERFCDALLYVLGLIVGAAVLISLDEMFGTHLLEKIWP